MVDLSDAVRGRASIWSVDSLNEERANDEDLLEHVGLLDEISRDSICEWEEGPSAFLAGSFFRLCSPAAAVFLVYWYFVSCVCVCVCVCFFTLLARFIVLVCLEETQESRSTACERAGH